MEQVDTLLITQARVGSSRLPEKVLLDLGGQTMLDLHLQRLKGATNVHKMVVATTEEEGSEKIVAIAKNNQIDVYQGDLNDVLDRFYQASKRYKPKWVVRVTSDCPLLDPKLVDEVIHSAKEGGYDYYSNVLKEDFPDGQDIEVFKFTALEKAWKEAKLDSEREHVTPYIRNNSSFLGGSLFKSSDYKAPKDYNHVRMTVDEPRDLEAMRHLVDTLGVNRDWLSYAEYISNHAEEFENTMITRNEGYLKSLKNDRQK